MRFAAPRVWLSIVALLLGAGLLAAAGLAEPAQRKGGTLRIARPIDIDSVDPAIAYLPDSWMIAFATCAKLYNYPDKPAPAGVIAIPEVATGLPTVSKDGKTQTIRLKRTYRFHTGGRITAANFVAAFNRVANPKLGLKASAHLHEIVGANAVMDGRAPRISGVRALDRYALEIRTTRPLPDLVSRLTMPFFCPIAVNTPVQESNDPLGSGPYYVASRVPNRQVVLERNDFYRGPRPANVDRALWTIHGREACRVAVERNELDYCGAFGVPSSAYEELAAEYGINKENRRFFFTPMLVMEYFAFNHDRSAFKGVGQIPLKQAINWAIDRPRLVRAAGYDAGKRTDQLLPAALGRDESIYPLGKVTEKRLAKARALLAKAKVRPRRLRLYTADSDPHAERARIFQFNLKRLGIDVEIATFSGEAFLKKIATRGEPYDVVLAGWSPDYADPLAFFFALDGRNVNEGVAAARFNRPRYTRAIARIGRLSGEARRKAWAELDVNMMRDDPPWAPFVNVARRDFVSKSFGCYFLHPVYRLDIAATCKK
jgi:ABC-type oligopeptide transport system substrate-binding subunit